MSMTRVLRNNLILSGKATESTEGSKVLKKKQFDDVVRFQVVLTKDTLERLDTLKELVGATTRVEVLRNALRLYDMIL